MNEAEQTRWDARYRNGDLPRGVARVLEDNQHLLPAAGAALEIACGRGGNALFLAARGLETTALDLSPVAIADLETEARARHLPLTARVCDLLAEPLPPACCQVLVVSRFLERALFPALLAALTPGGLLFYQTFVADPVHADRGPRNPVHRLEPNELLTLCRPFRILVYREEGRVGDPSRGFRDEAQLVARKPLP
ncbi:MAG: class I SAM-dependent methyltransferase [Magnetococcales bacterium]|nr:class I SAM-dependent methyltransferase [Magnetococcales bacterium]